MVEHEQTPVAAEARRISNELQFSDGCVNKAVKHFMKQMEEGLAKEGATLSQIPSYVAAVPNGTEKVGEQVCVRLRLGYADCGWIGIVFGG